MKVLFVILTILLSLSASAQEYGKKFVDIYVNINGQDPESFAMEDDTLKITSGWFEPKNFILEINNKTSGMLYVDFNKSYFILDGETSDVVPGETYIKDLNLEVKKTKIAPGARASLKLYSRERNNDFNPIFSSRQAHKAYKTDKTFLTEKLVLAFEDENGSKFKREFIFEVRAAKLVNDLKKRNQK